MGKQDRRLQKAKERERDVRQKKLASQAKTLRRRKLEEFPRFEIANRDAAPEFIEAVQKAAADIDFLEPQEFGELQKYLKAGKAIYP